MFVRFLSCSLSPPFLESPPLSPLRKLQPLLPSACCALDTSGTHTLTHSLTHTHTQSHTHSLTHTRTKAGGPAVLTTALSASSLPPSLSLLCLVPPPRRRSRCTSRFSHPRPRLLCNLKSISPATTARKDCPLKISPFLFLALFCPSLCALPLSYGHRSEGHTYCLCSALAAQRAMEKRALERKGAGADFWCKFALYSPSFSLSFALRSVTSLGCRRTKLRTVRGERREETAAERGKRAEKGEERKSKREGGPRKPTLSLFPSAFFLIDTHTLSALCPSASALCAYIYQNAALL